MTVTIIGISGFIGSGKGAVSDILVKQYGFKKISFADKLKDGVAVMFGWPRELLEGDTAESRTWRDTRNKFWSNEFGYDITPRIVLQLMGTECMRNGFHDSFWNLLVKQEIMNSNDDAKYVIPDVRFYNERDLIKSLGGEIWQVKRGSQPSWVDSAICDNRNGTSLMKEFNIHQSEYRWIDHDSTFDNIILNSSSVTDLQATIAKYFK